MACRHCLDIFSLEAAGRPCCLFRAGGCVGCSSPSFCPSPLLRLPRPSNPFSLHPHTQQPIPTTAHQTTHRTTSLQQEPCPSTTTPPPHPLAPSHHAHPPLSYHSHPRALSPPTQPPPAPAPSSSSAARSPLASAIPGNTSVPASAESPTFLLFERRAAVHRAVLRSLPAELRGERGMGLAERRGMKGLRISVGGV